MGFFRICPLSHVVSCDPNREFIFPVCKRIDAICEEEKGWVTTGARYNDRDEIKITERYLRSPGAAFSPALSRTRSHQTAPTRRPRKASGPTGPGSLSALARRDPPPRDDLGQDAASGALMLRSALRAGWRPQQLQPGRQNFNRPRAA